LAKNLGAKCFWLNDGRNLGGGEIELSSDALQEYIALESRDWEKIYEYLKAVN
jgi:imidazoleglycerol-phosphate dehydratase/histidinol-phosphatase